MFDLLSAESQSSAGIADASPREAVGALDDGAAVTASRAHERRAADRPCSSAACESLVLLLPTRVDGDRAEGFLWSVELASRIARRNAISAAPRLV